MAFGPFPTDQHPAVLTAVELHSLHNLELVLIANNYNYLRQ